MQTPQNPTHRTCAPDWNAALWDTDGFAHTVVARGGGQVVTTVQHLGFSVWDRRTGALLFPPQPENRVAVIGGPYMLRNRPLTDDECKRKAVAATTALGLMHAQAPMFCVAANLEDGLGSVFINGPFPSLAQAQAQCKTDEVVLRVACGERPSQHFCDVCGCDTSGRLQNHRGDCPHLPL